MTQIKTRARRKTKAEEAERKALVIEKLKRHYPDAYCALIHSNALELLVATILSAQCTDERVNQVTKSLFQNYRTAHDYAAASPKTLEKEIKPTGFFRAKAKSLIGMGQLLVGQFGGEVPKSVEALTTLPGVGRKTANVVMGNAFGLTTGIVVDTHVKRLSFRLGLSKQVDPEKVERDLVKFVPERDWIQFSHWLIEHGRQVCKARKPACEICFLEGECPKLTPPKK